MSRKMFAPQMPERHWTSTILYVNSFLMLLTGWVFFIMQRPFDGLGYIEFGVVNLFAITMRELNQWETLWYKQQQVIQEDEDDQTDEDDASSTDISVDERPEPIPDSPPSDEDTGTDAPATEATAAPATEATAAPTTDAQPSNSEVMEQIEKTLESLDVPSDERTELLASVQEVLSTQEASLAPQEQ